MEDNQPQKKLTENKIINKQNGEKRKLKNNIMHGITWMTVSLIIMLGLYVFNSGKSAKIILVASFLFGLFQFILGLSKLKK